MYQIIEEIKQTKNITKEQLDILLHTEDERIIEYLYEQARNVSVEHFGKQIYIRGLIEFSNYCKNNCFYCGLR